MSEYQYYEFLALDKPLTSEEKTYVESLSSRVELTSTQAVFVYNYGDFSGEPKQLLEKCFDVMLYMANWGSRQLMFRLPISLVDPTVLEPYCLPRTICVSTTRNFFIVDINICDEEMGDWAEGSGLLVQEKGQDGFQFAQKIRKWEEEFSHIRLDGDTVIDFFLQLPNTQQQFILMGMTANKETTLWKKPLENAYSHWHQFYVECLDLS